VLALAREGIAFDRSAVLLQSPEEYRGRLEEAFARAGRAEFNLARGAVRPDPAGPVGPPAAQPRASPLSALYLSLGESPDATPEGTSPEAAPRGDRCRRYLWRWMRLTIVFETLYHALMQRFKRNQIEQAISRMFNRQAVEPSIELRTRLKRLLETDRALSSGGGDPDMAHFAFFSSDAPGSGVEVWFSAYEAFALLTAWRLLEHGWPQATAVSILRQVRPQLEREHARILKLDPEQIFDQKKIREKAKPGSLAVNTTDPVFLVIASMQGDPRDSASTTRLIKICRGEEELMPMLRREVGLSATTFELVAAAHVLQIRLGETAPSKRGRGSS